MQFFDGVILVVFLGFVWFGFWRGLIQTFGSVVGIFLGVILASRWYDQVAGFFGESLMSHDIFKIIIFIILFLFITKITGFIFYLIHKAFNIAAVLPGMKLLNRLAGLVLGAVEGALFLGVILNFIKQISENTILAGSFANSELVNFFVIFASWLVPLFPEAIRKVNEVI